MRRFIVAALLAGLPTGCIVSTDTIEGPQGDAGLPGNDGAPGKDGASGKDGMPGLNGSDGVSPFSYVDPKTKTDIYYSGGNVGIGTSEPEKLLTIRASLPSSAVAVTVENVATLGGAGVEVIVPNDGNAAFFGLLVTGHPEWYISADPSSNSLRVARQGFPDSIFIDGSSGAVGIGTTNPAQPFHVAGRLRTEGMQMPGYGKIEVFHGANHQIAVPWTQAEVAANYGTTYTWADAGPRLRDVTNCALGVIPGMLIESSVPVCCPGQYVVTFTDCANAPCIQGSWSGWELRLSNQSDTIIAGTSAGRVDFGLATVGNEWVVNHMSGQVGTTLFECH